MQWFIIAGLTISALPLMALSAASENIGNGIQQHVLKKLAAGEKPNRLINEQSPYLLQHAFNPVDWYPWGEEAFTKAASEDKPLFLSIGYSTCHWCHVMAHESFDNKEIAELLNKHFISIKVDREERPDIDQMYMAATQAMTGSGGWPMSVFMLADGSPFYAGTYFPPRSQSKRPGFKDLLTTIHRVWLERREDLKGSAAQMVAALLNSVNPTPSVIKDNVFEQGFTMLRKSYDPKEGGFGMAPKFPRPVVLSFLFSHYLFTGEETAREMALYTMKKMAAGGMYDQLGGGFHRYSVDANWFVPHFEKMLYDQAQLANSYLDAFQLTKDADFSQVANEIFTYLLRDMRDPAGGFYSAEDADSDDPYNPGHHGEGAYFLWTKEDIEQKLGVEAAAIFNSSYGVKSGGNVDQDSMKEFSARNILYQAETHEETARRFNKTTADIRRSLAVSKEQLFNERLKRKRPHLDDKIITAWNGMTIGALARGSRILKKKHLLLAAEQTANFIEEHLYNSSKQTLMRRYRNREAGLPGQLSDYAYLVDGLLDLYQASHNPRWLRWAVDLTEKQIEIFWNKTGHFFFDSVADPSVRVRLRNGYDGAEPAGNSVAAHNLIRLSQLQNNPEWQLMARRLIESFGEDINRYPPAVPHMLTAWRQINAKPSQVIVAGKRGRDDTEVLLQIVENTFSSSRLILLADGGKNQSYLAQKLPFIDAIVALDGKATAYVCSNFSCKQPTADPKTLELQLKGQKIVQ